MLFANWAGIQIKHYNQCLVISVSNNLTFQSIKSIATLNVFYHPLYFNPWCKLKLSVYCTPTLRTITPTSSQTSFLFQTLPFPDSTVFFGTLGLSRPMAIRFAKIRHYKTIKTCIWQIKGALGIPSQKWSRRNGLSPFHTQCSILLNLNFKLGFYPGRRANYQATKIDKNINSTFFFLSLKWNYYSLLKRRPTPHPLNLFSPGLIFALETKTLLVQLLFRELLIKAFYYLHLLRPFVVFIHNEFPSFRCVYEIFISGIFKKHFIVPAYVLLWFFQERRKAMGYACWYNFWCDELIIGDITFHMVTYRYINIFPSLDALT